MTQVVLAAHQIAVLCQKSGSPLIAAYMLRNSVDDLHHAPERDLGDPLLGVDGVDAVTGRIGKLPAAVPCCYPLSGPRACFP